VRNGEKKKEREEKSWTTEKGREQGRIVQWVLRGRASGRRVEAHNGRGQEKHMVAQRTVKSKKSETILIKKKRGELHEQEEKRDNTC